MLELSKRPEQVPEKRGLAESNGTHHGRTCSYTVGGDAKIILGGEHVSK